MQRRDMGRLKMQDIARDVSHELMKASFVCILSLLRNARMFYILLLIRKLLFWVKIDSWRDFYGFMVHIRANTVAVSEIVH